MNKTIIALTAALLSTSSALALEIPLTGGTQSSAGGPKIAYVDMERIFQIYPQTQAAKEDYAKQLKKKKEQLAEKEAELREITSRLTVLEATLKDMGGPAGTTPAEDAGNSSPQSVNNLKTELETKKAEFEDLRKRAASDLSTFQSQQSQMILGKIYQALKDVASEEQVAVVVDKSSILYGDAAIDLTEKLQQRVRGY